MRRLLVNVLTLAMAGLVVLTIAEEYDSLEVDAETARIFREGVEALNRGAPEIAAAKFDTVVRRVPTSASAALLGACAEWDNSNPQRAAVLLQLSLGNGVDIEVLDTCVDSRSMSFVFDVRRIPLGGDLTPGQSFLAVRPDRTDARLMELSTKADDAIRLAEPGEAMVYLACLNQIGGFEALGALQAFVASETFRKPVHQFNAGDECVG